MNQTITLQGTEEQISKVQLNSYAFPTDELPIVVETRVYVLYSQEYINELPHSDDEFMTLAEESGRVYSLQGFQEAFNAEEINSSTDVIKIINVKI